MLRHQRVVAKINLNSLWAAERHININPFHATGLFLYPLKTSENLWFSDVIRGIKDTSDMKWVKAEEQSHMNSNQKQQF